jgi:hypothetical protein
VIPASEQLAARIRGLPVIRCRAVLYLTATHADAASAVGHSIDLLSLGADADPAARAAELADRLTGHVICGPVVRCPRCERLLNDTVAFLRDLAGQCRDCGALLPGHQLSCPRHVPRPVTE